MGLGEAELFEVKDEHAEVTGVCPGGQGIQRAGSESLARRARKPLRLCLESVAQRLFEKPVTGLDRPLSRQDHLPQRDGGLLWDRSFLPEVHDGVWTGVAVRPNAEELRGVSVEPGAQLCEGFEIRQIPVLDPRKRGWADTHIGGHGADPPRAAFSHDQAAEIIDG